MPINQIEIKFTIPSLDVEWVGGPLARKIVGAAAGDILNPRLFNHAESKAGTLSSMSLIRFGGGRRCIRILGIGSLGIADVEEAAVPLFRNLVAKYGIVQYDRRSAVCALAPSDRPKTYLASNIAVSGRPRDFQKLFLDCDAEGRRGAVLNTLRAGFHRQSQLLSELYGDEFESPASSLDDWNHLIEGLVAVGPFAPQKMTTGNRPIYYTIVDAVFYGHFDLKGAWHVGRSTNAGLGHVWHAPNVPHDASRSAAENWQTYLNTGRGKTTTLEGMIESARATRERYRQRPPTESTAREAHS